MQNLNLPKYEFKIRQTGEKLEIFDEIRKKYLVLNPEEWVRQNLVKFLISDRGIPAGLISIERGLKVNKLNKRTDIVIYNKKAEPVMIVECKAPNIKIDQKVFEQIARYNMSLRVPILMVSNGLDHYTCSIDFEKERFKFLDFIPDFEALCNF